MKLQDLADRRFSYDVVGSTTRPELTPPGYHRLEHRARIGDGDEVFLKAGEVLMSWQMHSAAGLRIEADSPRAEIGTNSLGRFGVGEPPHQRRFPNSRLALHQHDTAAKGVERRGSAPRGKLKGRGGLREARLRGRHVMSGNRGQ